MTIQWIQEDGLGVGSVDVVDWFEGEPQWGEQGPAGLAGVGLGQPPTSCPSGATPAAYTTCRNQAYQKAVSTCTQQANAAAAAGQFTTPGGGTDEVALQQFIAQCRQATFYANFNASNCFQYCYGANPPCTDLNIIRSVQEDLGRAATGVWTADDQAALDALGTTFTAYAPDCTGPAPTPVPSGGPAPVPPTPKPKPVAKKGAGLGVVLLAAAAAVAIAMAQT